MISSFEIVNSTIQISKLLAFPEQSNITPKIDDMEISQSSPHSSKRSMSEKNTSIFGSL